MDFKNKQNLELDDQGGNNVPPSGGNKLSQPNLEMGPLGFPRKCEPVEIGYDSDRFDPKTDPNQPILPKNVAKPTDWAF